MRASAQWIVDLLEGTIYEDLVVSISSGEFCYGHWRIDGRRSSEK